MERARITPLFAVLLLALALSSCDDGLLVGGPLNPIQDRELEGSHEGGTFVVPSDVTVTLTGSTEITVTDSVRIEGAVEGDCVPLIIESEGSATILGTVRTSCSTPPAEGDSARLTVVADGDITLEGAEIVASDEITIRHTGFVFPGTGDAAGATGVGGRSAGDVAGQAGVPEGPFDLECRAENVTFRFEPARSQRLVDGKHGADGADFRFGCSEIIWMDGGVTITAQHGAHGASLEESAPEDVDVISGSGGEGGDIFLAAPAVVARFDNTLRSGDGGNGGTATATSEPLDEGDEAPWAWAVNIQGGFGGEVLLFGEESGVFTGGTLEIVLGNGGDGGDAVATGAAGQDATSSRAAQDGGNAAAQGGEGGAGGRLRTQGSVSGDFIVSGGDGGDGGHATATPGPGGSGSQAFPAGAEGGNVLQPGEQEPSEVEGSQVGSVPGDGGFAGEDHTGQIIGAGGSGGDVIFEGGPGGNGWDDCGEEGLVEGGAGGKGGDVAGRNSQGRPGVTDGQPGDMIFRGFGNGGEGGDGLPAGGGGVGGTDHTFPVEQGERIEEGDNFQPGPDGTPCEQPPSVTIEQPQEGAVVNEDQEVTFSGSASDPEDGELTGGALVWTGSVDGELGTGASFTLPAGDLTTGSQTVTLTATDSDGSTAEASVEMRINALPVVTITAPESGVTFTNEDEITLQGTAEDSEDGLISEETEWYLANERVGAGSTVTVTYSVPETDSCCGVDVRAEATDNDGATGSDQVSIHIDHVPEPAISSPPDGATYLQGEAIPFEGSATDREDGTLTGDALQWESSLDGPLGTGTSFSRDDLSVGDHDITLTATDSDSLTAVDSVAITVAEVSTAALRAGQSDFSSGEGAIVTVPTDGSGSLEVLIGPVADFEFFSGMAGNSFVYARAAFGTSSTADLWHAADDGTGRTNLTDQQAYYRRGSASPDGSQVVFESDRDDPQSTPAAVLNDVFVMNADGTAVTRVIADAGFPSFTPSGRIVYSSDADADGHYEIRIADADGSNAALLLDDDDANDHSYVEAVVSPTGAHIALTRENTATFDAVIMVGDFDGQSVTNLRRLETGGDGVQAAWSPSGDRIAFTSTRSGSFDIWVADVDGSNVTNLTRTGAKEEFHPFWGVP